MSLNSTVSTYLPMATVKSNIYVHRGMFGNIPRFLYKDAPVIYNIFGVMFNIILIFYFFKTGKYRIPTFTLLTSLSMMDTLCCISGACLPTFLFPTMEIPGTGFTCALVYYVASVGLIGSEYHLVFFAALRFYQLAYPLPARARITPAFIVKGCIAIFLLLQIFIIPITVFGKPIPALYYGELVTVCSFDLDTYAKDLSWEILTTIIPCTAICVLHIAKYIAVARAKNSFEVQQERRNADAKAVTIVIVLFFVAWIPAHTYMMIQNSRYENYNIYADNLYLVFVYFMFTNSAINPIVYVFAAKTVRDDVLKLFCSNRLKMQESSK